MIHALLILGGLTVLAVLGWGLLVLIGLGTVERADDDRTGGDCGYFGG